MTNALSCELHFADLSLAVNKAYSNQASEFAAKNEGCFSLPFYPNNTSPKCRNNECVLVLPSQLSIPKLFDSEQRYLIAVHRYLKADAADRSGKWAVAVEWGRCVRLKIRNTFRETAVT
jgi:hypothetical protein